MTNYQIADYFTLLSKLSDIHGENSFKVKGYGSAAFAIEKLEAPIIEMSQATLYATRGIGASTGKKIEELLITGNIAALQQLIENTPPGIIEMMQIKGLGPKKIITIWKELEIETIGELLYACNENRLLLYKGFGAKNQQSIKESIAFYLSNQGNFLWAQAQAIEPQITTLLQSIFNENSVRVTGNYLMHNDIIEKLEFVIHYPLQMVKEKLVENELFTLQNEDVENKALIYTINELPLKICLYYCADDNGFDCYREERLFFTSGSLEFTNAFKNAFPNIEYRGSDTNNDAILFEQAGIQYIPPYLRYKSNILNLAKANKIPTLITANDVKGIIHSHSNWSDGTNTIEEMANACIAKGMEYLVISDHSKSAFYAKGLEEERIHQQHILIDALNKKLAPFQIFKSIECDILNDGSLDYSDNILSTFDLVITSVHSNLKMTEEKAMARLLTAIENPYTTILGHMSGRLLLSRPGYPLHYPTIIDACAANNVVIELNAHPSRLDIDWSHIEFALQKGVLISINPDAHSIEGYTDIEYGVIAAQKALVQPKHNLSSFTLQELNEYLFEIRQEKGV